MPSAVWTTDVNLLTVLGFRRSYALPRRVLVSLAVGALRRCAASWITPSRSGSRFGDRRPLAPCRNFEMSLGGSPESSVGSMLEAGLDDDGDCDAVSASVAVCPAG